MRKRVPSEEPITLQEIEEALAYVTYIVGKYGKAYLPVLRRLEREVEAARQKESPGDRARRAQREARVRIEPRGMTREDAAAYCSLSPAAWDRWVSDGRMPPRSPARIGGTARLSIWPGIGCLASVRRRSQHPMRQWPRGGH